MAGLPTNNNAQALKRLGCLLDTRGKKLSPHAATHWQQVLHLGFPTYKHENWKYTPLDRLLQHPFCDPENLAISEQQRDALALPLDAYRLVFINGHFSPSLSDRECGNYKIEIVGDSAQIDLPSPLQPEVFMHLTESLAQETTLISLDAGQQADKPLYLLHISSGRSGTEVNTVHYRHHLMMGSSTQAQIIEHYASLNHQPHFTGARLTVSMADNAQLTHYKLAFENPQSDHFSHNDMLLARDVQVKSHSFLLGAGLTRHNTSVQLNGEGGDVSINSLLLPGGKEICDTRTYLVHNKGYCKSRQLHKTIVHERGRAVFNGVIKVAQHALKTDGQMTNNNLLLSHLAEVDTKPQLEIYADDVKCSHGATVGRIDANQLLYLQSRGISKRDAQQMITFAFAAELTEVIENEVVRKVVMERITERLQGFPIQRVRADFPLLAHKVNDYPLIYLDSAASAQKPQKVIDRELNFYQHQYAAVHRGTHTLSAKATNAMENIREQVAKFIHAKLPEEIVFVKGTTEAINLVANSYGRTSLQPGDSIIITEMEHHANIVPWQILAKERNIAIRVWPITRKGELDTAQLTKLIDSTTKLLAITQVSNVLGTVNPIKEIVSQAKAEGLVVLVDGAQAVMHQKVDVQTLDCDFYAFSGHKMYGPSGIGILYAKKELLQAMPPWEGGGAMIKKVTLKEEGTTFADPPWRFEAGSPNTVGIMGLGAAIEYISELGLDKIHHYEQSLMNYALKQLKQVPTLKLYGPEKRQGVIAFNLGKHHALDVACFLDQCGIAIRTGHHCAMPLMALYDVTSMCRVSLALYNTHEEIDQLVAKLKDIQQMLG